MLRNESKQRSIELVPLEVESSPDSDNPSDISLLPTLGLPKGIEHNTGDVVMGSTESTTKNVQECNAASLESVWPDPGFYAPRS